MDKLNISVVVPLYNEAESLPELAAWIDRVMRENGFSYELILIDDGSSDGSWEEVERLKTQYPAIRGIGFARNYGKSAALYCGFAAAEGEVVITMDADLQDSPDEIPELRRMILEEGYDLVSGGKRNATTRSANAGPANSSTGRPGPRRASGSTISTAG